MSKNVKISNPMKVITGVDTRWSYANVWEPKSINGGTPKYSVSLIIPKSDTKTIAKIEAAIEAAYKEGEAKLKGNGKSVPALSVLKTPLRDGDAERPDDEAYKNAYRLDQRIKSDTMEAQNLREMAGSVSAIQYDKDRVQASRNTEAPFVRTLEKLWTLEKKIAGELEMLSDLKKQIREVIEAVPDTDERMVLKYRYIHNYTWEQIGMELCADARTIRRWHGKALLHVTLPDNPIII